MAQQIELSDETYQKLQALAEEQGLTPAEWIEARLSRTHTPIDAESGKDSHEGQTLADTLQGYIGVIDSSQEPYDHRERTPLGDMVAEKLAGQGIKAPWQR
jgi:predicted transcriptional regulator